jgi:DNA polymerase III alpha subunit
MCNRTSNTYAPLHVHSHYSLLDGLPSPLQIAERAKEINAPAIALTDHGNVFGIVAHQQACKKFGIKPIVGIELYICQHDPTIKSNDNNKRNHLTVLAKNPEGVQTLMKLVSETNRPDWFYRKPRIDLQHLSQFASPGNLICLSGCLAGELSEALFVNLNEACLAGSEIDRIDYVRSLLVENWRDIAAQIIKKYQNAFGKDNYYIEIQEEGMIAQKVVIECLREIAKSLNIPTVATLDSHYARKDDAEDHRILLYSQMHTSAEEQERIKQSGGDTMAFFYLDQFYIFDHDEMLKHYTKEEIEASLEIADRIQTENLGIKPCIPKFRIDKKLPSESYLDSIDSDQRLKEICINEAKRKLGHLSQEKKHIYWNRLSKELSIIKEANLADYFLIVWDICKFVDENNGPRGKGRGSGAGSLVNYLTNITQIDPIEYELYFERFYNASRNIPPHFSSEALPFMEWYSSYFDALPNIDISTVRSAMARRMARRIKKGIIVFDKKMKEEVEWIDKNNPYMWQYLMNLLAAKVPENNPNNSHLLYGFGLAKTIDTKKDFNPHLGHISLPDIDIDVGVNFRSKVVDYLTGKWGESHVAQMITFGRLQGRAALKEVFRAQPNTVKHLMKVKAIKEGKDPNDIAITSFDLCNEITSYIPDEAAITDELEEIRKASENPDYGILNWAIDHIDQVKKAYEWYKPLFDQAMRIEGTKKSQSKHAAGIVIANKPIAELVPLAYDAKNKNRVVGLEMSDAEKMGCVKFDVLGVVALDKCWYAMSLINGQVNEV